MSENYYRAVDALQGYALKAFRQALAELRRHERVQLPDDFDEIMRDPQGELPEKVQRKLAALSVKRKQLLVFAMVSAVHDGWVRDNPQYFFDNQYADEKFLFLRIELCGIYVYQEFLDMIMQTVRRLGLETSSMAWDAESMYMHKRHKFICEHDLTNSNLVEYIANCGEEYVALSSEISTALKRDPMLAKEIAGQVIMRTPVGGIDYC